MHYTINEIKAMDLRARLNKMDHIASYLRANQAQIEELITLVINSGYDLNAEQGYNQYEIDGVIYSYRDMGVTA